MSDEQEGGPAPGTVQAVSLDDFDRMQEQQGGSVDVAALQAEHERLKEAFRNSESIRQALEMAGRQPVQQVAPQPVQAPTPQPVQLTREQLATLFQEDPLAAVDYMNQAAIAKVGGHFAARLDALSGNTVAVQQQAAKQRYATEFELFGKEIEQYVNGLADKTVLGRSEGWDQLIGFVRGQPGNIEKFVEREVSRRTGGAALHARNEQIAQVGFAATSRPAVGGGSQDGGVETHGLTAEQMRAADATGVSYKDYKAWM